MPDDQLVAKKHSYTVPCASTFRDAVTALAAREQCNVADLARSVVLMTPRDLLDAYPDPGEPERGDRETVILKSGRAQGKPWRRKPRLQVRMPPGLDPRMIRKALALALDLSGGRMRLKVQSSMELAESASRTKEQHALLRAAHDELERLRGVVEALHFEPLAGGVQTRSDALHVMGFPPGSIPSLGDVRARFRRLATVYHPDGKHGCHQRMSQVNAAMEILRRGGA
ncbi:MAG: J domain-containing protein [Alphaproteobacteria bacterium]|nr:J domain-containing protein [Alphaproteobacteria bacterium]